MEANLSPLSAEYAVLDQVVEAWAESSLDLAVIVVRSGDENQVLGFEKSLFTYSHVNLVQTGSSNPCLIVSML